MRKYGTGQEGAALVWVLVVMTVGLLIVGAVSALSSVNMRMARFETDYALALYAAESGINHALALIRDGEDADAQHITEQLQHVELPEGGSYSVEVEGSGTNWTVTSTGTYRGRERQIQVSRAPGGGSVFRLYTAQQGDDDFPGPTPPPVEIPILPEWDDENVAKISCAALNTGIVGTSAKSVYKVIDPPCHGPNIYIENAIVLVDEVHIFWGGTMSLTNAELHVAGNFLLEAPSATWNFQGDEDNNIYVKGDMTVRGSALTVRRTDAQSPGEDARPDDYPWDYVQVGGHLIFDGSAHVHKEKIPHIVFAAGCDSQHKNPAPSPWRVGPCVDLRGSSFEFVGGIYAPTGAIRFLGDPYGFPGWQGIGSIVGKRLEFQNSHAGDPDVTYCVGYTGHETDNCPLRDRLQENWTAFVRDRMQTVKFRGDGGASSLDWTVLR